MPGLARYRTFATDSARWSAVELRPDDIIISTPPKCGTTWMQVLCALLIGSTAELPGDLSAISPWVDICTEPLDVVVERLRAQTHRRFMKTHTPLDGLPWLEEVTYVCVGRDPRDVAISWDRHVANTDIRRLIEARVAAIGLEDLDDVMPRAPAPPPGSLPERLRDWVDDDRPPTAVHSSLEATLHHLETFWEQRHEPNVVRVHYAELEQDLLTQLGRLAARLGISATEGLLHEMASAASFGAMKDHADQLAPEASQVGLWLDNERFFAEGRSGTWRTVFTSDLAARYQERAATLAPPDLLTWVHQPDGRDGCASPPAATEQRLRNAGAIGGADGKNRQR